MGESASDCTVPGTRDPSFRVFPSGDELDYRRLGREQKESRLPGFHCGYARIRYRAV